jgi:glycosyltransferase involved in cell wall biosynthesis
MFLIGIVGQMLPEKGHDEFLQAAAALRGEFPKVHFLIVGNENAYGRELKHRVQAMGLAGTVHFHDFMTDIVGLYNTLDAVAVPYHHEAFGRVIIEAMACGKPVVTTWSGAGREIIDDGVDGVLVPPRQGEALAQALRDLVVDDRRREHLAAAGREKVLRRFHIEEHARKVEALYEELLECSQYPESREIHTTP